MTVSGVKNLASYLILTLTQIAYINININNFANLATVLWKRMTFLFYITVHDISTAIKMDFFEVNFENKY